jgi:tripartite-type tricarboxylate transporter receptor subunit TctC
MPLMRRQFLHLAGASIAAGALPRVARAERYPSRPVRVIVPVAAGGPSDVIARVIGQKLSDRLGHHFYVENMPSGASNVGTGVAAKAPADGHTIAVISSAFVINTSLYTKIPYDPIKDFVPIMLVATSPHVLTVNPSLPAHTVKEFIALVKANPGKYSYASAGAGQSAHLAAELFKLEYGLDLLHVPFNGGAPAIMSTIAGHTPIAFNALPSAATVIKDGKLRALAVTSSTRAPEFPDVPTFTEVGVANQVSNFINGIVAPAGTSREIVDLLHRETVQALAAQDVKDRLAQIGFIPAPNSPDEFQTQVKAEIARWAKVIHDAKIGRVE